MISVDVFFTCGSSTGSETASSAKGGEHSVPEARGDGGLRGVLRRLHRHARRHGEREDAERHQTAGG